MPATPLPTDAPRRARFGSRHRLAVVLLAVAAGVTACFSPVVPDNRPTIPAGERNGALTAGLLEGVTAGCAVHRDLAPSLRALLAAAASAGVALVPTSCYRDHAGQEASRAHWCAQGACHMAAVPGTSNHGWGKAVDFGTHGPFTFESTAYRFLRDVGWIYGWNHPAWARPTGSAPEPWHWEWVGDGGRLHTGSTIGPQR